MLLVNTGHVPELFPASVRTIGVAVRTPSVSQTSAAAYLQAGFATWFVELGHSYLGIYTIVLLLVEFPRCSHLREPRHRALGTIRAGAERGVVPTRPEPA
ncbi:hypothetical protein H351_30650 (plasmid) [Rhodococcus erythropolis R138]|nr:hypothetical protein H351_30650 [Rhodococcus erythropolis R138]